MTASDTSIELGFEPPGPGSWEQDPVHFPRPLTRYFQETHPPSFKRGTNDFARFYGMVIDGLQIGYVKGFAYNQVLPAPDAEIPQRFERAEQVFAQKLWREQLRDWDENRKPSSIATHSEAPPPGLPPRDPVAALRRVELFADMDRRQAEQIARLLKERHFAKGETVIMEGSGGAALFLIDSGEATVSIKGVHQGALGPGDYFGEIALIDGGPRTATVTAATALVCYGLTFWEFRPLVERNGAIGWKLLKALAKRVRTAAPT